MGQKHKQKPSIPNGNKGLEIKYIPSSKRNAKTRSFKLIENNIQSTLVISKSKGPSETLLDIRTSTYQICRNEENTNRTTEFHKGTCNLTPLIRNICLK